MATQKWRFPKLEPQKKALVALFNLNDAAFKIQVRENVKLMEENKRLRAGIARLVSDRPYILGFNDGWDAALEPQRENAEQPL
ncbi:hypothetical protein [Roseibium album]|uniref:hypothetical protein n=1 Tax=Roseibium album TaxID=311410 RepID=UPI000D55A638|nr:cell division protein FtsB [Labrenzia sp. EL_195]